MGGQRKHLVLYSRFAAIVAITSAASGKLGRTATWLGRGVVLLILLRRLARCVRGLPSKLCRGAPGGKPMEASIAGLHRRFLELYGAPGAAKATDKGVAPSAEAAVEAMQKRMTLKDGQEIAYWDVGPPSTATPVLLRQQTRGSRAPVLFCNGLGARVGGWAPLLDALHSESASWSQRRLVIPEYRGQFASTPLVDEDISMERSASDIAEVADELGLKGCTLLCWSTGVQVGLEVALRRPDLVGQMVLLQGTSGEAFESVLQPFGTLPGFPTLMAVVLKYGPKVLVKVGFRTTLYSILSNNTALCERISGLVSWVFGTDFMAPILIRYTQDIMRSDSHFINYCKYIEALGRHKLARFLPGIQVPALIMTGTPDCITPARCSYDLAAALGSPGGAELYDDVAGSHYYIFEEPHKCARRMVEFLEKPVVRGASKGLKHKSIPKK